MTSWLQDMAKKCLFSLVQMPEYMASDKDAPAQDTHADRNIYMPRVVVVLTEVTQMVALPVESFYTFPDCVKWLYDSPPHQDSVIGEDIHTAARSVEDDAVFRDWANAEVAGVPRVKLLVQRKVALMRGVVTGLRRRIHEHCRAHHSCDFQCTKLLPNWAAPMTLSDPISGPVQLAKLSFLTQYEAITE